MTKRKKLVFDTAALVGGKREFGRRQRPGEGMDVEKPRQGMEIELKLQVRSEDLSRLRDSPLLSSRAAGPGVTRTLESVYFDTADLRLRRRNTTLRVRKQGRHYVQTVKTGVQHRGGALHRGEWESP